MNNVIQNIPIVNTIFQLEDIICDNKCMRCAKDCENGNMMCNSCNMLFGKALDYQPT